MNEKIKAEIDSLENSVLRVVEQSRKVASMIDVEPDLLEELQQIAIALHYTIQTLKAKVGLSKVSAAGIAPLESPSDLRMTTNLPLKTVSTNKRKTG